MQTSLPDLPFTGYGQAQLCPFGTHSASKSTPWKYPRTDLNSLVLWNSFPDDIHRAVQSATARVNLDSIPIHIDAWRATSFVENEEMIRSHATFALHRPVEQVLGLLGVMGRFILPGGGNVAIVGAPDFSWIGNLPNDELNPRPQLHPKLVVCVPVCLLLNS